MATITLTWAGTSIAFEYGFAMSVQKEFSRGDDGSIINEKHTLSVKGQIVAGGATADARYSNLATQMFSNANKHASGGGRTSTLQAGLLIITGDSGEIIRYDSANLVSVSVGEPPEDTAGLHHQEVNMSFESYNVPSDPASAYKLRSVNESIEYKKEENQLSYKANDIAAEDEPYHAFTVTHTISAQGMFNNGTTKREAFEEAYRYVNTRKKDSASSSINIDNFSRGYLGSSQLEIKEYKIAGQNSDIVSSTDIGSYNEYNKIRTSSVDLASGSYSLTTTFLLSREDVALEISGEYSRDENGDASITISGTIQGLSNKAVDSAQHNKIVKARAAFETIAGNLKSGSKIFSYASSKIYDKFQIDKAGVSLKDIPLSQSFGENKNNGTITFSVTYKVYPGEFASLLDSITGSLVAQATIIDNNRSAAHDFNQIVIVPIVGRSSGPIIQDMGTTKERTRSATIDVTLEPQYRTSGNTLVRTQSLAILDGYQPTATEVYIQNFSENWDWTAGKYNVTIDWTYVL